MIKAITKWFRERFAPDEPARHPPFQASAAKRPPARRAPPKKPAAAEPVQLDPAVSGEIESLGPGKNVLVQNQYQRGDSGTQDDLKIVDEAGLELDEADGIDPYNTGKFDRSRNWDSSRFRK